MSTIQEIQTEIIEDFAMFDDWMQKYEYLIDLGKELSPIKEQYKTEDNLIKGCQSRVWLYAKYTQGKIIYTADSDATNTHGKAAGVIDRVTKPAITKDQMAKAVEYVTAGGKVEAIESKYKLTNEQRKNLTKTL